MKHDRATLRRKNQAVQVAEQPARGRQDANHELRIRAAWIYYVEGLTQSDVAKKLGVNRIAVTRLLSEARRRGEVIIRIKSDLTDLVEIERALEDAFGLDAAVVAPVQDAGSDPTRVIAAAAGAYISELMRDDLTVGVGWGRTLHTMLPFVDGRSLSNVRIVSLLGGIAQAKRFNPAEFAWRFAELFDAEGFLIPAPALVDSAQTKTALLERCGLNQVLRIAETSDLAILSAGGMSDQSTSFRFGHISDVERRSLIAEGAVGDILYNFIDAEGRVVDHPVNERTVSIELEQLARIPHKVLISGGTDKIEVLHAAIHALRPTCVVADEHTAVRLLERHSPRQ